MRRAVCTSVPTVYWDPPEATNPVQDSPLPILFLSGAESQKHCPVFGVRVPPGGEHAEHVRGVCAAGHTVPGVGGYGRACHLGSGRDTCHGSGGWEEVKEQYVYLG